MGVFPRTVDDRVIQYSHRYQLSEVSAGVYDLTPVTGIVTKEGTAINKQFLQPIEQALYLLTNTFTCTGLANTYLLTINGITSLADLVGIPLKIKLSVDATGSSTLNINSYGAKSIVKPNGVSFSNGKSAGLYTVVWNGTNFILQGSDSSGNASPADLLDTKTASTDNGDIVGTMPNNGTVNHSLAINGTFTIPAGYHNGLGKITQTITVKTAQTYSPSTSTQTISAGQYLSGDQTISPIVGTAGIADVLETKTFNSATAGINKTGTMPNRSGGNSVATNILGIAGRIYLTPLNGYWNGSVWTYFDDPNFVVNNLRRNKTVLGLSGGTCYGIGDNVTLASLGLSYDLAKVGTPTAGLTYIIEVLQYKEHMYFTQFISPTYKVFRINNNGEIQWQITISGNRCARSIDSQGNLYVVSASMTIGSVITLYKYNSSGTLVFSKAIGTVPNYTTTYYLYVNVSYNGTYIAWGHQSDNASASSSQILNSTGNFVLGVPYQGNVVHMNESANMYIMAQSGYMLVTWGTSTYSTLTHSGIYTYNANDYWYVAEGETTLRLASNPYNTWINGISRIKFDDLFAIPSGSSPISRYYTKTLQWSKSFSSPFNTYSFFVMPVDGSFYLANYNNTTIDMYKGYYTIIS